MPLPGGRSSAERGEGSYSFYHAKEGFPSGIVLLLTNSLFLSLIVKLGK